MNTQIDFRHLAWVRAFQCIGLPLFFVPLNTIAYGNLPKGKNNNASAMMNLMRNLGGGIGISLATTMLFRRQQFHQDRLAASANMGRQTFVDFMNTHGGFGTQALTGFYRTMQSQALMLSFIDVFKVFGFGCFVVVAIVLMLKKTKKGSKAPAGAH
jgi:DHA2 family multidrug resistance protein